MSAIQKSFSVENEQKRKGHHPQAHGHAHCTHGNGGANGEVNSFRDEISQGDRSVLFNSPPLLGRPLLHPYISLHETAIVSRSRPGCYELRSAPWYAYMHACMKYVCIRASRTVYAVVSDVSMEDGLRKDRFSFRVKCGTAPIPLHPSMSFSHSCMHARAQSSCSPWSRRYEIRCVVV